MTDPRKRGTKCLRWACSTRRSTRKKRGHKTRAASKKRKVNKGMGSMDWLMPTLIKIGARLMRKTAPKAKARPLNLARKLNAMGGPRLSYRLRNFFPIGHQRLEHVGCAAFGVNPQNRLSTRRANEQPGIIRQDVFGAIVVSHL